jgi:hypothetical protein
MQCESLLCWGGGGVGDMSPVVSPHRVTVMNLVPLTRAEQAGASSARERGGHSWVCR